MNRWLGLLLAVTVVALLISPAAHVAAVARPEVGYRAPDIQGVDAQGQPVSLASLRGQAVVLNFWATWCGPCRAEMPELQAFYQRQLPGVKLVGVNLTAGDGTPDAVKAFLQARGLTYPVWFDPQGAAADAYNVQTVPTTYFVDGNGVIRDKYMGPMTQQVLEAGVAAAGGKP